MSGDATACVLGNLVKDPECRDAGKTRVANFTLAVNKKRNDVDYVSYFDCCAWGRLADVAQQYLSKGRQVYVVGDLVQDRWEKDGVTHSRIRLHVTKMQMLGGGNKSRSGHDDGQYESNLSPESSGGSSDDFPSDAAPF